MEKQFDLLESSGNLFHESPEIIDLDNDDDDNDSIIKALRNNEPNLPRTITLFDEKPSCSKTAKQVDEVLACSKVTKLPEIDVKPSSIKPFNEDITTLEHVKNDVTADITCEFLEIAIQQILYHRGIYPKEIFKSFKKYHVSIHLSLYPDLLNYIVEFIKPLKPLIKQDQVKQVVVLISQNSSLYEKFVFELMSDRKNITKRDEDHLVDLELSLRECLLRIATYTPPPPKDPENCSFEIMAQVERSSALQLLHQDEDNSKVQWVQHETCNSDIVSKKKIDPLKTVNDSPYMKMQLFVLRC